MMRIKHENGIQSSEEQYKKGPRCPRCLGNDTRIVKSFYQEGDASRGMDEIDADECFCNSCKVTFYW